MEVERILRFTKAEDALITRTIAVLEEVNASKLHNDNLDYTVFERIYELKRAIDKLDER